MYSPEIMLQSTLQEHGHPKPLLFTNPTGAYDCIGSPPFVVQIKVYHENKLICVYSFFLRKQQQYLELRKMINIYE